MSHSSNDVSEVKATKHEACGDQVPFGDPYWYQGFESPFYTESHKKFRAKVRAFVEKDLMPNIHDWEEAGAYPRDLLSKAYEAGVLAAMWPKQYGGTQPEKVDAFHDLIMLDELARCGGSGVMWGPFFSFSWGLPPVLNHGSQELKDRIARDIVTGRKLIALAVSEPYVGSDVGGMRTTAKQEGDYWIINGEKKFITSGMQANYFTVAARTGSQEDGNKGISVFLVERENPGVTCRKMKTQGAWVSGTALVILEDVKVHKRNLIGKVNEGFKIIMFNFNHERFVIAALANRFARVCLEDAIKYAQQRKTFGKALVEHQIIRHKIAEMARQVEATHALLEQVAFQMSRGVPDGRLGPLVALAKVQATQTMDFCAREASQVLGGAACIRGGKGDRIERIYREVRMHAIAGGSEEILRDLAVKAVRVQPNITSKL